MKTTLLALALALGLLVLGCAQRGEQGPRGQPGERGERGIPGTDGAGFQGPSGPRGEPGEGFQVSKLALDPVVVRGGVPTPGGTVVVEARCAGPELTLMMGGCWVGTPSPAGPPVDSETATLSTNSPVDAFSMAKFSGWHCAARGLAPGEVLEATASCFDYRGESP